jgi:hypothetical protein
MENDWQETVVKIETNDLDIKVQVEDDREKMLVDQDIKVKVEDHREKMLVDQDIKVKVKDDHEKMLVDREFDNLEVHEKVKDDQRATMEDNESDGGQTENWLIDSGATVHCDERRHRYDERAR